MTLGAISLLLNNAGQILWLSYTGKLILYRGAITTEVDYCDSSIFPGLNNRGQIAYQSDEDALMLYNHDNGVTICLEAVHRGRNDIQINDDGQVLWSDFVGIAYLATPKNLFGKRIPPILSLLLLD